MICKPLVTACLFLPKLFVAYLFFGGISLICLVKLSTILGGVSLAVGDQRVKGLDTGNFTLGVAIYGSFPRVFFLVPKLI